MHVYYSQRSLSIRRPTAKRDHERCCWQNRRPQPPIILESGTLRMEPHLWLWWPRYTSFERETLNTKHPSPPIELCLAQVFLVILHVFSALHGSTCSFIQKKKTLSNKCSTHYSYAQKIYFGLIPYIFKTQTSLARHMTLTIAIDSSDRIFIFFLFK